MTYKKSLKEQQGSMLLEGLIAILIFSIGILSIIGLQAATVRHTADAKYRVDASFLANETIGKIWADRANMSNYAEEDVEIDALPGGTRTVAIDGNEVTVTVTWQLPGQKGTHRYTTVSSING